MTVHLSHSDRLCRPIPDLLPIPGDPDGHRATRILGGIEWEAYFERVPEMRRLCVTRRRLHRPDDRIISVSRRPILIGRRWHRACLRAARDARRAGRHDGEVCRIDWLARMAQHALYYPRRVWFRQEW